MSEIKLKPLEELAKEVKEMDIVEIRILMRDRYKEEEEIGLVGYFHLPSTFNVGDINYYLSLKNDASWNERDDDGWIVLREGKIMGYRILGNSIDLQEKKK